MPGVCAACLISLGNGEKFVLMGTEVVHPGCVGRQTERTKLLMRLNEETRRAGNLAIEERRQREMAVAADREHLRVSAELREVKETMRRRFHLEDEYRAQRDNARAERDRAFALRDEALRAAEAARREAALHQTLGPAPAAPATPEVKDERDPSEIRFSLLDLDPL
jgi:hypothetical protein